MDSETLDLVVRTLLSKGEAKEARAMYDRAVDANPTLEDTDLERDIAAELDAVQTVDDGPVRLRLHNGGGGSDDAPDATGIHAARDVVTFDDVGGLDPLKKRIRRRVILPLKKPGLFQRFRRKAGGGILLYGAPGCGKTLMARAIAGECGFPFYDVKISDVLDMWIGSSEQRLAGIFQTARAHAPSVLFFDEVEALGAQRRAQQNSAISNLVSHFLNELDGYSAANDGVLVLAATNVPWAVDAAFRRPGRFDRVLFVPPPDRQAREAILYIHLRDRPVAESVNVRELARKTSGFSGADLQNLVETAVDEAIAESIDEAREVSLSPRHFTAALEEVRSTTSEWLTTARNYAKYSNEGGQYDEVLDFLRQHGR